MSDVNRTVSSEELFSGNTIAIQETIIDSHGVEHGYRVVLTKPELLAIAIRHLGNYIRLRVCDER